ncbi:uncharacterized protein EV422DRAFT_68639 [Fimicolochytrium jonesii]|uniref:uncharacterized protein n=1 Tax=Fimicolochytrium jonesii TaxID=1396493 RepID=UPI0022FE6DF2|nr:uncharacterized protein EV422DRAFT_68639 [Fimicolochytrium jonesii]KAI8820387.1 hypothetical protein EV422DRAFT_68639 [Fimicolochytrium jonesii]
MTMGLTLYKEGFSFNLKWGIYAGIFSWTACVVAFHIQFVTVRAHSYELPLSGTGQYLVYQCVGFVCGYEALSLMLLKWMQITTDAGMQTSPLRTFATKAYRYFVIASMVWFPPLMSTYTGRLITAKTLEDLEVFYKFNATNLYSMFTCLVIHALGILYSGHRLSSTLDKGRQMVASTPGISTVGGGAGRSNPDFGKIGRRRRKGGVTATIRNLMLATVVGWLLLSLNALLDGILGLSSKYGLWSFMCDDAALESGCDKREINGDESRAGDC